MSAGLEGIVLGIGEPVANGVVMEVFVVVRAIQVDELVLLVVLVSFAKCLICNDIGASEAVSEAVVCVVNFDDGLVRGVFPRVLGDSMESVERVGDGIV